MPNERYEWTDDPWYLMSKYHEEFKLTEEGKRIEALVNEQPQEIFPQLEAEAVPVIAEDPVAELTQPLLRPPQPQPDPLHSRLANWPPRTETPAAPRSFPTEPGTIKKPPTKLEPTKDDVDMRFLY